MWDLNADMNTEEDARAEEESHGERIGERSGRQRMDNSGTSSSSMIVNAAEVEPGNEDSNSSNGGEHAAHTFTFEIMNNGVNQNDNIIASSSSAEGSRIMLYTVPSSSATSQKSDWLNLSFPDSAKQPEMRISLTQQQPGKKSRRGPRSRSSQYRGVTFYRRTGRWESHIWDCGKQVYLGGFDTAHTAARAYDRAAIKFRGMDADINFTLADYQDDIAQMKNLSKEEFVHTLRRQTTGFARGSSKYRGVTLPKCGRWEAQMGQLLEKKAYDVAALSFKRSQAATNFDPSTYHGVLASQENNKAASNHDLDLRLSLDSPSDYSPKFVCSTTAAGGSMPPNYQSQRLAIHSGSYMPTSHEIQSMAIASPGMPNWGHNSSTISRPPFSSAASSGFSLSSSVTPASSLAPLQLQQAQQSFLYRYNYRKS